MSNYKSPKARPKTEKHLGQLVSRYSEASGLAVRRVRQRISAMVFIGALARVLAEDSPDRFLVKGGLTCELRFPGKARMTRDLDAVFRGDVDGLLADLDLAFAEPYSGFSFSYSVPEAIGDTRSVRIGISVEYASRHWATLRVEVSPAEGSAHECELVPALTVSEFGLTGPREVACLSLRYQIAQKIHACTERFQDRENERVQDLIDLMLMEELIEDIAGVRDACIEIFELRATHPWPPTLGVEPGWLEVYPGLAEAIDFPILVLTEATERVQALIDRIAIPA